VNAWLVSTEYAFAFFGIIAILVIAPWVQLQYRRFGGFRGWPAVVSAMMGLYAVALVAFTLFPLPTFTAAFCRRNDAVSHWQWTPFNSLDDVTAYAADHSVVQTLMSDVFLQVFFNVLFFVPLGFFVAYRFRRGLLGAALISLAVSMLIEVTQGTAIWGLAPCAYRLADVDDLLTNTVGGLVGWAVGLLAIRLLPDPLPVRAPDVDVPSRRRRALGVSLDLWTYLLISILLALAWSGVFGTTLTGVDDRRIFNVAVTLVLFVVIPGMRGDRAGPGFASVLLVLVRSSREPGVVPAQWWCLVVRWGVRWMPLAVFGWVAFAFILALDALVSLMRRDRRSLSDLLSATHYVTRDDARARRIDANEVRVGEGR